MNSQSLDLKSDVVQAYHFQKHHFTADIPFLGQSGLRMRATLGSFLTSIGSALTLKVELQAWGDSHDPRAVQTAKTCRFGPKNGIFDLKSPFTDEDLIKG